MTVVDDMGRGGGGNGGGGGPRNQITPTPRKNVNDYQIVSVKFESDGGGDGGGGDERGRPHGLQQQGIITKIIKDLI